MKILIDTNVLISATLFPNSTPYNAYVKALTYPNEAVVCEQNIDEFRRIFNKKFPNKLDAMNKFLSTLLLVVELVPTPIDEFNDESKLRDINDRPILRAAIKEGVDIVLTGDKDFLESDIGKPRMLTPSDFLNLE